MHLYAIHDTKANYWGAPWGAINDAVAARIFKRMLTDYENFPQYQGCGPDFNLYRIADYSEATGEVTGYMPCAVISGANAMQEIGKA